MRNTITPEHVETICVMMSEGKSLRSACRELGLPESSVRYHLMKSDEAFAHSAHARELGCDALADECLDIADNATIEPADKRIRIDTRIRLIGKWSQRYSDKLTVNTNKTVTHKYDLDSLSDERLDELERILTDATGGKGGAGEAVSSQLH